MPSCGDLCVGKPTPRRPPRHKAAVLYARAHPFISLANQQNEDGHKGQQNRCGKEQRGELVHPDPSYLPT